MLRFLADESCDFIVVRALRAAGWDVRALAEETNRSVDAEVIAVAASEQRILLTEDKGFGWLQFVSGAESAGVILIRFPAFARRVLGEVIVQFVAEHGSRLPGTFAVVQPGHVRLTPRPGSR